MGGSRDAKVIDLGLYSHHIATDERPTEETFLEAHGLVPSNLPYDECLQGLMGIHDFFGGSYRG